jgi:hypothetical protein
MKHNKLIIITFAAMYLECVIWDYAASNFGKTYIKTYLENMNLSAKWLTIPKLVNDTNVGISSKALSLLVKLVKERNAIVHSKSKAVPGTYDEIKKIENKNRKITVAEVEECINKCLTELKKIDTKNYWLFRDDIHTHTIELPCVKSPRDKRRKTLLT